MIEIKGSNNFVLISNFGGDIDNNFNLGRGTALITNGTAEVFESEEALNYRVAQINSQNLRPLPQIGKLCEKDKIYAYGEHKVRCLQEHFRMHYAPETTPALFLVIKSITDGYPQWKQPVGGHDAYNNGDRVMFENELFESIIDANVWSPFEYPQGWKKIN